MSINPPIGQIDQYRLINQLFDVDELTKKNYSINYLTPLLSNDKIYQPTNHVIVQEDEDDQGVGGGRMTQQRRGESPGLGQHQTDINGGY